MLAAIVVALFVVVGAAWAARAVHAATCTPAANAQAQRSISS